MSWTKERLVETHDEFEFSKAHVGQILGGDAKDLGVLVEQFFRRGYTGAANFRRFLKNIRGVTLPEGSKGSIEAKPILWQVNEMNEYTPEG